MYVQLSWCRRWWACFSHKVSALCSWCCCVALHPGRNWIRSLCKSVWQSWSLYWWACLFHKLSTALCTGCYGVALHPGRCWPHSLSIYGRQSWSRCWWPCPNYNMFVLCIACCGAMKSLGRCWRRTFCKNMMIYIDPLYSNCQGSIVSFGLRSHNLSVMKSKSVEKEKKQQRSKECNNGTRDTKGQCWLWQQKWISTPLHNIIRAPLMHAERADNDSQKRRNKHLRVATFPSIEPNHWLKRRKEKKQPETRQLWCLHNLLNNNNALATKQHPLQTILAQTEERGREGDGWIVPTSITHMATIINAFDCWTCVSIITVEVLGEL